MQKTALVTGGSKGIGLAIVNRFLDEGFKVYSVSRSIGDLSELSERYAESLKIMHADFMEKSAVLDFAESFKQDVSKLEILVNNAGVFLPGSVSTEEEGTFEKLMALNINAPYYLTRALMPLLKNRGSYIFNICSTAGIMPYINGGSYCISKHALHGFSKVLRLELADDGVGVSTVIPGATYTDSWAGSGLPEIRFMKPENIANCIWNAWENREYCVMEEILLRPLPGDI